MVVIFFLNCGYIYTICLTVDYHTFGRHFCGYYSEASGGAERAHGLGTRGKALVELQRPILA